MPWISGAERMSRQSGRGEPEKTGMVEGAPIASRTLSVLAVTLSMGALPLTVLMPMR